jgi:hypothetical protein
MIPSLTPAGIAPEEPMERCNSRNVMNFRPFVLPGLYKVE